MDWSFAAVGPVTADVQVPSGTVDVQTETDGQVHVALVPGSSSRKAEELVEASKVSFDAGRLDVHVPSKPFKNAEVFCTLTLPEGSAVSIKTASADVDSRGTLGDLRVTTASGDCDAGTVEGQLTFTTASGDLRCDRVTDRVRVRGASGDVTIGHTGGAVEIALASGDVEIGEASTSVKLDSASGDLQIRCAREGEIRAKTVSGDVVVGVASGVGAYLDVRSVSGEMRCTLPFDEAQPGDAKLRISCDSVSGDVSIVPAGA